MLRIVRNSRPSRIHLAQWESRRSKAAKTQENTGILRKFSENIGAVGLALGLILSAASLYDVFIRKPEADRISALSQFNQAVSSAAKTRQELIQMSQSGDPATRLAVSSMAMPRILNDISTARALLPELRDDDVGMPQLLILISESMTAGDNSSAERFIARALEKNNLTPYMAAEARRYSGKYMFATGRPNEARSMYLEASKLLGDGPATRAAKAFNLADLIGMQYAFGHCGALEADIDEFIQLVNSQGISLEIRAQLTGAISSQLSQFSGQRCQRPRNSDVLVIGK